MINTIKITNNDFIEEGVYQKCYRHPGNNNLCIKIRKQEIEKTRLANEINYSEKISKKKYRKVIINFFQSIMEPLKQTWELAMCLI